MTTSLRRRETRNAAAKNPLYALLCLILLKTTPYKTFDDDPAVGGELLTGDPLEGSYS
jgi:hypothetical protein